MVSLTVLPLEAVGRSILIKPNLLGNFLLKVPLFPFSTYTFFHGARFSLLIFPTWIFRAFNFCLFSLSHIFPHSFYLFTAFVFFLSYFSRSKIFYFRSFHLFYYFRHGSFKNFASKRNHFFDYKSYGWFKFSFWLELVLLSQ